MIEALTERSAMFIMLMFSEPAVREALIDNSESNLWSKVTVDSKTGDIVLGKTRFMWWNQLIGATKRISLDSFTFRVIGVLQQKAENDKDGRVVRDGLANDVIDGLSRQGRSNDIIDRLFLVGYLGVKTSWSCLSLTPGGLGGENKDVDINLHINDQTKRFVLPGSRDAFIEVAIGPKGARFVDQKSGD